MKPDMCHSHGDHSHNCGIDIMAQMRKANANENTENMGKEGEVAQGQVFFKDLPFMRRVRTFDHSQSNDGQMVCV